MIKWETEKRVVVVEDDQVTRMMYRTFLEKAGYNVQLACDGEAGWQLIQESHPHVILLDVMLPKISGPELLKRLKAAPALSKIPVIVFTNALIPTALEAAKSAGADLVLDKSNIAPPMVLNALTGLLIEASKQKPQVTGS
jgi:CheY-like chemotaxis protein